MPCWACMGLFFFGLLWLSGGWAFWLGCSVGRSIGNKGGCSGSARLGCSVGLLGWLARLVGSARFLSGCLAWLVVFWVSVVWGFWCLAWFRFVVGLSGLVVWVVVSGSVSLFVYLRVSLFDLFEPISVIISLQLNWVFPQSINGFPQSIQISLAKPVRLNC